MTPTDELQDPETAPRPPRAISRVAFYGSAIVAAVVLAFLDMLALRLSMRRWGVRGDFSHLLGALCLLNYGLCYAAGDAILKRLGLSRSDKVVEGQTRAPALLEPSREEVIEILRLGPQGHHLAWGFLAISLIGLLILATPLPKKPEDMAAASAALFFGGGLAVIFQHLSRRVLVRADSIGIAGYAVNRPFRRRFVPWDDVASCEIETTYDPVGSPILVRPTFRDAKGTTLLTLNLKSVPKADQERLLKFIKARLPKTVFDP